MTFGEAVSVLKRGGLVARSGWNGKNMHVYLEDASLHRVGAGAFKGHERKYAPYLVLVTPSGVHQPGWNASTPDVLSEDWVEVPS